MVSVKPLVENKEGTHANSTQKGPDPGIETRLDLDELTYCDLDLHPDSRLGPILCVVISQPYLGPLSQQTQTSVFELLVSGE